MDIKSGFAKLSVLIIFSLSYITCERTDKGPETDSLKVSFEVTHVTVYGELTGEIVAHITGGEKPYFIYWSNGATDSIITGLPAGTYYIDVTDNPGNRITDSATINQPDSLRLQLFKTDASGLNTEDGSIDLEIMGGILPYRINWSTGDTIEDIDHLDPGSYRVIVTDIYGAVACDTIEIEAGAMIIRDIDSNFYATVRIGDQLWMKENLKVTHTPDGEMIESWYYNNAPANGSVYGRLYTWDVAMNGSVIECARGICPEGWHIPSDEEWKELEMYLGMTRSEADMVNTWRGKGVGTKLRSGGSSGYDALYSGRRSSYGSYDLLNQYEYIWTSTEYSQEPYINCAWRRCLSLYADNVGRWNTFPKTYAFSVRCVQDE